MKSYTFDNLKYKNEIGFYDINIKTVVDNKEMKILTTSVEFGEDMRMDKISERLYGSTDYEEELMVLNGILLKFNIKFGDIIKYVDYKTLDMMHEIDEDVIDKNTDAKLNKNNVSKNTKKDKNRKEKMSPTDKSSGVKSVNVNRDNNTIEIINTFS